MSARLVVPGTFAERRATKDVVVRSGTDGERVVLRDLSSVVIRPLVAGDEATIDEWFVGLRPKPGTRVS